VCQTHEDILIKLVGANKRLAAALKIPCFENSLRGLVYWGQFILMPKGFQPLDQIMGQPGCMTFWAAEKRYP
jgi:hypothetical protein